LQLRELSSGYLPISVKAIAWICFAEKKEPCSMIPGGGPELEDAPTQKKEIFPCWHSQADVEVG
jgi:hypothetical protein